MILLKVPDNNLNIGAIDIQVYADKNLNTAGELNAEQWATFLALIAPFLPPPIGTKAQATS